ncbi:hypothetical protein D3C80_587340 [compost metagenome]
MAHEDNVLKTFGDAFSVNRNAVLHEKVPFNQGLAGYDARMNCTKNLGGRQNEHLGICSRQHRGTKPRLTNVGAEGGGMHRCPYR